MSILTEDLESHLVELELRLQAPATRSDAATVADLLSDDFREFGASGRVWGRTEMLAALAAEASSKIVSDEFTCTRLASDVALLTYVAASRDRKSLRSSLWRLEGDRWRLVFHQGTVVPLAVGERVQA